jgi:hypothetical protein
MRSAYKLFKGTLGFEEVLMRANEFVSQVGRENLVGINTTVDPSDASVAGRFSRVSVGASTEEIVVIVWYWVRTPPTSA